MGGTPSGQPRPSYEDEKVRDPALAALIKERTPEWETVKNALRGLLRRATNHQAVSKASSSHRAAQRDK